LAGQADERSGTFHSTYTYATDDQLGDGSSEQPRMSI